MIRSRAPLERHRPPIGSTPIGGRWRSGAALDLCLNKCWSIVNLTRKQWNLDQNVLFFSRKHMWMCHLWNVHSSRPSGAYMCHENTAAIDSDNGLPFVRCPNIMFGPVIAFYSYVIWPLGTDVSDILIQIQQFPHHIYNIIIFNFLWIWYNPFAPDRQFWYLISCFLRLCDFLDCSRHWCFIKLNGVMGWVLPRYFFQNHLYFAPNPSCFTRCLCCSGNRNGHARFPYGFKWTREMNPWYSLTTALGFHSLWQWVNSVPISDLRPQWRQITHTPIGTNSSVCKDDYTRCYFFYHPCHGFL